MRLLIAGHRRAGGDKPDQEHHGGNKNYARGNRSFIHGTLPSGVKQEERRDAGRRRGSDNSTVRQRIKMTSAA